MSTTILRSQHCCERRIVVLISLLHVQQDALTQYKDGKECLSLQQMYEGTWRVR
jgi:hypothetical protein